MAAKKAAKKTAKKAAPTVVAETTSAPRLTPEQRLAEATEALQFAQHRLRVAHSYNDWAQRAEKIAEAEKGVEATAKAYEKAKG